MLVFRQLTYDTDTNDECKFDQSEYVLPIKPGDVLKFIVDRDIVFWKGDDASSIEIGISSCGVLVYENIGIFNEINGNLYCEVVIPDDIGTCSYEIMFYSTSVPVECGDYAGFTLEEVIDENITLGDVINCKLEDFIL